MKVTKIIKKGEAKRIVTHRLEKHDHDMLVIGLMSAMDWACCSAWTSPNIFAISFRQTTLYVPAKARPFVNPDTGEVTLKKNPDSGRAEPPSDLSFSFFRCC